MSATDALNRKRSSFRLSRVSWMLLLSVFAVCAAAAPARADHDRGSCCDNSRSGQVCRHKSPAPHWKVRRSCKPSFAERQYKRGARLGKREGWRQGYADGMNGFRFLPESDRCLKRYSRPFRDGYLDAFEQAYRLGYRKGRWNRYRHCW